MVYVVLVMIIEEGMKTVMLNNRETVLLFKGLNH